MTRIFKIMTAVMLLMLIIVSCKEEKEKDYRDVWCGPYQLTIMCNLG